MAHKKPQSVVKPKTGGPPPPRPLRLFMGLEGRQWLMVGPLVAGAAVAVVLLWPGAAPKNVLPPAGSPSNAAPITMTQGVPPPVPPAPTGTVSQAIPTNRPGRTNGPLTAEDMAIEYLNEGTKLFEQGRITEAIARYQLALAKNPEDEDIYYNLAIAYAKAGQTNEAIKFYEETLKRVPEYLEAHNNLGNLLGRLGRFQEAEQHFREALKVVPDHAEAHNNLGTVLGTQGRRAEAVRHFREALKATPDYVDARQNLANALLLEEQLDEAIAEFEKVLAARPESNLVKQRLALARQLKAMQELKKGPPP